MVLEVCREMVGVGREGRMSEEALGGFLWLVKFYLPLMLERGSRILTGYPVSVRKLRWEHVRAQMLWVFGVDWTVRQWKHHWQDSLARLGDLLDYVGVMSGLQGGKCKL